MSRAEWLARGSVLALAGCSPSVPGGADAADATAIEAASPMPEAAAETGVSGEGVANDAGSEAIAASDDATSATRDVEASVVDAAVGSDGPSPITCGDSGPLPLLVGEGRFLCAIPAYVADAGTYQVIDVDGAVTCDRSTEYCDVWPFNNFACRPLAQFGCNLGWCDSGVLGCRCVNVVGSFCIDDDAGGLNYSAPCYGAPPARPERPSTGAGVA